MSLLKIDHSKCRDGYACRGCYPTKQCKKGLNCNGCTRCRCPNCYAAIIETERQIMDAAIAGDKEALATLIRLCDGQDWIVTDDEYNRQGLGRVGSIAKYLMVRRGFNLHVAMESTQQAWMEITEPGYLLRASLRGNSGLHTVAGFGKYWRTTAFNIACDMAKEDTKERYYFIPHD